MVTDAWNELDERRAARERRGDTGIRRRYPADPPTTDEIVQFIQAIPTDTRYGRRMAALVILLWRTGLRISEALALDETDLDPRDGSVLVKAGKGGKRRKVGMDPWGWQQIRPWLDERAQWPAGKVFCVLDGPTAYRRAWNQHDVNSAFRAYETRSGVRRRMAPHQFRHRLACDWVRAGVPMPMLQRQLGHANLQVTTIYLQGINVDEVLDVSRTMPAPNMPLPTLVRPAHRDTSR